MWTHEQWLSVTPKERWRWVFEVFGVKLPWKTWTLGHSSPWEFVHDALTDLAVPRAVWANRSGGKTLGASILAAMRYRFATAPMRGIVLSGNLRQAKQLYGYWQDWCYRALPDMLLKEPTQQLTSLSSGTMEIVPATQAAVRGPKVQLLFRDERDEIEPGLLGPSAAMLDSRNGHHAVSYDMSTWHKAGGPMSELVEVAEERGIHLHKWNVWEAIAPCPDERHDHGRNCESCFLSFACLAKARQRNPGAKVGIASHQPCGLLQVENAISMAQQMSRQEWDAELECKRPSLRGTVYPQFDRAVHVRADLDFSDSLPTYRAIDFGLNDFVCLWIQVDKQGRVYVVDEYWAENTTVADNARAIRKRDGEYPIEATYVDPAGRNRNDQTGKSSVDVLRSEGIPCKYSLAPWGREVRNGIHLIRSYLEPAAGSARLYIAAKCKGLIGAMESYALRKVNGEYIDEPIKPQPCDHICDAIRYFYINRMKPVDSGVRQLGFA